MNIATCPTMAGLLAGFSASAAISIDTVIVGDANNDADTTGYGAVSYNYRIGTYEVTNSQYTAFLNATATTDTHGLYNSNMSSDIAGGITRSGTSGSFNYSVKTNFGNKPVNFVSFWDAARFTNWLTNGQGNGDTETGVYILTTQGINENTITRNETAWEAGGVAIASGDEWYKAAYYNGDNDIYHLYPNQSDSISEEDANYDVGSPTDVGSYEADSFYGTFDQAGNVWEWNESIVENNLRVMRGGSFSKGLVQDMKSSTRFSLNPTIEDHSIGFRVSSFVSIPEPSAYAAILGCLALAHAVVRRRGRGTL